MVEHQRVGGGDRWLAGAGRLARFLLLPDEERARWMSLSLAERRAAFADEDGLHR